jgi:IS30 family transposase
MTIEQINPARVVLARFADAGVSARAISRALSIEPSTVGRWPERNKGAGDIPALYHRPLLQLAAQHGAQVTAETLILGR